MPKALYAAAARLLVALVVFSAIPMLSQIGVTDAKWDVYVFKLINGRPSQVYQDGKQIAIISGGSQVKLLSGSDASAVQKSFDDFMAARNRGGGSTPAGTGTPKLLTATDIVTWVNGEPRVTLADGWEVAFRGGNGSKIDAKLPSGEKIYMEFTEAAKGPGGAIKGLGVFVASAGQKTSALEGGAWTAKVVEGGPAPFYNQNNGTRNYKNVIPPWAQQAAAAALKAERLVAANADTPKYAFTGTGKLAEISGPVK